MVLRPGSRALNPVPDPGSRFLDFGSQILVLKFQYLDQQGFQFLDLRSQFLSPGSKFLDKYPSFLFKFKFKVPGSRLLDRGDPSFSLQNPSLRIRDSSFFIGSLTQSWDHATDRTQVFFLTLSSMY
jgi:hypothetical protein